MGIFNSILSPKPLETVFSDVESPGDGIAAFFRLSRVFFAKYGMDITFRSISLTEYRNPSALNVYENVAGWPS